MKKHYYTIDVTTSSPQALKTPYDDCLVGLVLTKNGSRALDVVQYDTYNYIKYYIPANYLPICFKSSST